MHCYVSNLFNFDHAIAFVYLLNLSIYRRFRFKAECAYRKICEIENMNTNFIHVEDEK